MTQSMIADRKQKQMENRPRVRRDHVQSHTTPPSSSRTHAPLRLESFGRLGLRKYRVTRQTAHASGTVSNGAELDRRDTAAVAPDAAGIACGVCILELARRRKVKSGERVGLPQKVRAGERSHLVKGGNQWRVDVLRGLVGPPLSSSRALGAAGGLVLETRRRGEVDRVESQRVIAKLGWVGESGQSRGRRHGLARGAHGTSRTRATILARGRGSGPGARTPPAVRGG